MIIIDPLQKALEIFLGTLYAKLHTLCAAPLYSPAQWQWSITSLYFLSSRYLFSIFFCKYNKFLHFRMIPAALLLITSFFFQNLLFLLHAFLRIQNFSMQSLSLYTSCLLSMLLTDYIVDIQKHIFTSTNFFY